MHGGRLHLSSTITDTAEVTQHPYTLQSIVLLWYTSFMTTDNPVIVYGAEWCAFCHVAMDYFNKIGVKYEYRDVDTNKDWIQESIDKSGQTGIPVLDFNGTIVVGFDRPKIDATLASQK